MRRVMCLLTVLGLLATFTSSCVRRGSRLSPPVYSGARDADAQIDQLVELLEQHQYEKALALARHSLELRERQLETDHPDIAWNVLMIGIILRDMGRRLEAEPILARAQSILERIEPKGRDMIMTLQVLASVRAGRDGSVEAIRLAQRSCALCFETLGPDAMDCGMALRELAVIQRTQGDLDAALNSHTKAVAILERDPSSADALGGALIDLAAVQLELGQYGKSEETLLRAIELLQRIAPGGLNHGIAMSNLAGIYSSLGDGSRARDTAMAALGIMERAKEPRPERIALALHNLGVFAWESGDYMLGEEYLQRALDRRVQYFGSEHTDVAWTMHALGIQYTARGDHERARAMLEPALEIRLRAHGPTHPDVLATRLAIANNIVTSPAAKKSGRSQNSATPYDVVLAGLETSYGKEHPAVGATLLNIAAVHTSNERIELGRSFAERALSIAKRGFGEAHPSYASALIQLGAIDLLLKDYEGARTSFERALQIRAAAFGEDHPLYVNAQLNLAEVAASRGDYANAVRLLSETFEARERSFKRIVPGMTEPQRRSYFASSDIDMDMAVDVHVLRAPKSREASRMAMTAILARKGRLLDMSADTLQVLLRNASPEVRGELQALARARAERAAFAWCGSNTMNTKSRAARDAELMNAVHEIEAGLSRRYAALRDEAEPVSLADIQKRLGAREALVELVKFRALDYSATDLEQRRGMPRYAAYVLHRQGDPQAVDLGDAAEIERMVEQFRKHLSESSAEARSSSEELDRKLIRPIEPLLRSATTLWLSSDAALNLIPFGALVDAGGRYRLSTLSLTYLTSGRDLLRIAATKPSRSAAAMLLIRTSASARAPRVASSVRSRRCQGTGVKAKRSTRCWPARSF